MHNARIPNAFEFSSSPLRILKSQLLRRLKSASDKRGFLGVKLSKFVIPL
jgi:hypothetical protein